MTVEIRSKKRNYVKRALYGHRASTQTIANIGKDLYFTCSLFNKVSMFQAKILHSRQILSGGNNSRRNQRLSVANECYHFNKIANNKRVCD